MRATSIRRAPQRMTRRALEARPLEPGACPHCFRHASIGPSGRRRHHSTPDGGPCTGGGILVDPQIVTLTELPAIVVPPRSRRETQVGALTVDGRVYVGGSDRAVAHGRATCPGCERQLPLNGDGTIRRHRVRHQDPLAPHCTGIAPLQQVAS